MNDSDQNELNQYFQDEMISQNIPALAAVVFQGNQIIYENYQGKSHVEKNVNLASDHLFLLASISKMVTATALLQLYERGLFSLDDEINDYLPFTVDVPNHITPITFRMLLVHTSAIADGSATDDEYYDLIDSPTSLGFFLENYLVPDGKFYSESENFHPFEPGTQHEYSNEGSALIAVLVESIAKKEFNTYCKENIFHPLGMTHTFWRLDEIAQAGHRIVQPYEFTNGSNNFVDHYTFTDYPNGGLRSTATDLFSFLRAFALQGLSNGHLLLRPGTIDEMLTSQIPSLDDSMGLHAFHLDERNDLWGHDGGEQGASTIMAVNPTNQIGAIILTNQSDVEMDEMLVKAYEIGTRIQNRDADGDSIVNGDDLDDDNDGILDIAEGTGDTDGDGIPDRADLDSDNDSISDLVESGNSNIRDSNNDGMADGTADGNGVINGASSSASNTDNSGQPDFQDSDSDADGITDILENGYGNLDRNGDGKIDSTIDEDKDGIIDNLDTMDAAFGFFPGQTPGCIAAGVNNSQTLLDYALGPHRPHASALSIIHNSSGTFSVSILRPDGRPDLNYHLERSADLSSWSSFDFNSPHVSDEGDGTSTWKWTSLPLNSPLSANLGFFRVRISTRCFEGN